MLTWLNYDHTKQKSTENGRAENLPPLVLNPLPTLDRKKYSWWVYLLGFRCHPSLCFGGLCYHQIQLCCYALSQVSTTPLDGGFFGVTEIFLLLYIRTSR